MKNYTKLTGVELNCIEVAVQHYIDVLEDVIKDKHTSVLMYKSLKEKLNAAKSVKEAVEFRWINR